MSKLLRSIGLSIVMYNFVLSLNQHHLPMLPRSSQLLRTEEIVHYGMSLWEHIDLVRAINMSLEEKQEFLERYKTAIYRFCSLCRTHILTLKHEEEQLEVLSLCEDIKNNFQDGLDVLANNKLFEELNCQLTNTVLLLEASVKPTQGRSSLKIPHHIKHKSAFNHIGFKYIPSA